ncbi:hypothetical protein FCL47_08820 [Desulfopila sp. IMCC35006]|uniref:DNA-primase RepB domain-containing protein n=1 Tax=Desulfopila sp. IMCC35006 TaxID=2569542 RepID=UPI0010ACD00C|nr:DNA-primase RepB domain-containing protein [Desulfopila sp. IMCC35006]TKB26506.1 hypothetical protein FCL47_08820 [Desulfopila sp. IMCC35006]
MTQATEKINQTTSISEFRHAQTKATHGVLLSAEIVQFFVGKTDAFHLWSFAITQPEFWQFRKTHMLKVLGMGERKWRKALSQLSAMGLLEIPFRRDSKGKMIGKSYVFHGWNERMCLTTNPEDSESVKGKDLNHVENEERSNKNNNDSEACILPSSENCTDLFTSKGDVRGEMAQLSATLSTSSECSEEVTDDEMKSYRQRFLDRFPGLHTFQAFDDSKEKRKSLAKIFHGYAFALEEMNWCGAGVFLTVNETDGKGRKRENIVNVRAIFVDLDCSPLEPVLTYEPHLVVESSPTRFHAYWFVQDFPLEAFTDIQKLLADMFGGDPVVHDLSRVMRVPGFWHQKGDPFMSRIVLESHVAPLTHLDVVRKFPPKPKDLWSAKRESCASGSNYIGSYGAPEGNRNSGLMRFVGGAIQRRTEWAVIEQEAQKWAAACSPPLPDREVKTVLKSARRYL